jgi:putative oxidoreductase
MKFLQRLGLDFLPTSTDLALLLLRVVIGGNMLILHGWPKLSRLLSGNTNFSDPLGIGALPSLILAIFGEGVCSILLIFGIATRFAAVASGITMGVAFFLAHGARLKGENHGELAFVYLIVYVALLIAGSGRFAVSPDKK